MVTALGGFSFTYWGPLLGGHVFGAVIHTHALLWWLSDEPTLGSEASAAIAQEDNAVFVSAVTAWEISIKSQLGKLEERGRRS